MNGAFLTAEWRHLVMVNYEIDPAVLTRRVPVGTELDDFEGHTFVSMVGFLFQRTRLLGFPVPWHQHFEEVNLRFYVRRKCAEGWRRGVVFVRELVPRFAIALVARTVYGEPYLALPMRHQVAETPTSLSATYEWRRGGRWESLSAAAVGEAGDIAVGSLEEFITEHYWGYTARGTKTSEYEVKHPRWDVRLAASSALNADVATLYGPEFVAPLAATPASAFIADGSEIAVMKQQR